MRWRAGWLASDVRCLRRLSGLTRVGCWPTPRTHWPGPWRRKPARTCQRLPAVSTLGCWPWRALNGCSRCAVGHGLPRIPRSQRRPWWNAASAMCAGCCATSTRRMRRRPTGLPRGSIPCCINPSMTPWPGALRKSLGGRTDGPSRRNPCILQRRMYPQLLPCHADQTPAQPRIVNGRKAHRRRLLRARPRPQNRAPGPLGLVQGSAVET